MKKILLVLLISIFWTAWSSLGLTQELQQGTAVTPASVYVYEVVGTGQRDYREIREETILSTSNGRAKVQEVRTIGENKRTVSRTLELTSHSMPWSHTKGVWQFVRFPSSVGDTWKWTTDEALDGRVNLTDRMAVDTSDKFLGWEEVDVPAGKFRAAKIEHIGSWKRSTDGKGNRYEATVWYSPDVGRVVKKVEVWWWSVWSGKDQHETRLLSFKPGPDMSDPFAQPVQTK